MSIYATIPVFLSFNLRSPVQPHTAIIGDHISPPFIAVANKTQSYLVSVISDDNMDNTNNNNLPLGYSFLSCYQGFFLYSRRLFVTDQFSVAYFQLFEWLCVL